MKDFINDLIDIGIGSAVDMSNHKIVMEDEVYHNNMVKAYELQDKLLDCMTEEQEEMFEAYMEVLSVARERACNLSYLLGVKKMQELAKGPMKDSLL